MSGTILNPARANYVAASDVCIQCPNPALGIASDRMKARYGMPCRRALAQLARIETAAGAFTDVPDARVAGDGFDE